ncbi:MAG TPA: PDZ domain-containing protein [Pyrinomonadaceae bacterium]|jgi:membrane-associated protease RseP (regulator of RpoE activity)|nr:PDZ domain-containing protein [Pyrinomonadaceae bacterium]
MQPQQNFSAGEQTCSQCGAAMPRDMRFCRNCGNRLGEGPAEYTPTEILPGARPRATGTTPFYPSANAPLMQQSGGKFKRRRRMGFVGTTWMWIGLAGLFGVGGLMSLVRKNNSPRPSITAAMTRSYAGVDDFDAVDNGATFKNVEPPGGPADKAGLVGGDIITTFDGKAVRDDDDIMSLLGKTPIGKTVEVIYLRDGISHTTQLTTISRDELNRLDREYNRRPEGKGKFGFESDRTTPVKDPATKTFGVRMDYVDENGPADLFGIKKNDIITDFDNVPIRTSEELLSRVRRAIPYKTIDLGIIREGQRMIIPVKIGKA